MLTGPAGGRRGGGGGLSGGLSVPISVTDGGVRDSAAFSTPSYLKSARSVAVGRACGGLCRPGGAGYDTISTIRLPTGEGADRHKKGRAGARGSPGHSPDRQRPGAHTSESEINYRNNADSSCIPCCRLIDGSTDTVPPASRLPRPASRHPRQPPISRLPPTAARLPPSTARLLTPAVYTSRRVMWILTACHSGFSSCYFPCNRHLIIQRVAETLRVELSGI